MTSSVARAFAAGQAGAEAEVLLDQCEELGLKLAVEGSSPDAIALRGPRGEPIDVSLRPEALSMLEQTLRQLDFRYGELPLLTRGDSKELRLLTDRIVVMRLSPTVYSFTNNRYGEVAGTDVVRARFSAEAFRTMAFWPGHRHLSSAFLGLVEDRAGPLLVERRVEPCNLEVRVKRYHIGSPVHRYRYTERHPTARGGPPLTRWTRFGSPVVCFDWRHPLSDDQGLRLADEPISDDYAAIWMDNVPRAKRLARDTFAWLEDWLARRGLLLIDICFFVDRTGSVIFGEVSPDCMRVRDGASDDADAFDKDKWRSGGTPEEVLGRYESLIEMVTGLTSRHDWRQENGGENDQEPAGEDLPWGCDHAHHRGAQDARDEPGRGG